MAEFVIEGARPHQGHGPPGRQQERGLPRDRGRAAHLRAGDPAQSPRHRRRAHHARAGGGAGGRGDPARSPHRHAARGRPRTAPAPTPCCCGRSAGRWCSWARCWRGKAAREFGQLRAATASAAGAWTPTCCGLAGAGGGLPLRGRRAAPDRAPAARRRHPARRGERDRHRERGAGGGAGGGHDGAPQRGLRAACPGPLRAPRADGRAHRRHRLQPAHHPRRAPRSRGADFTLGPDFMEVGSFMVLAAVTGGRRRDRGRAASTTCGCRCSVSSRGSGINAEMRGDDLAVLGRPVARWSSSPTSGDAIPSIDDGPWPAFPADLMSVALVAATQAERHRAVPREDVREPALLRGPADRHGRARGPLRSAPRPGARPRAAARRAAGASRARTSGAGIALVIAALCADGRTVIRSIEQIDRGYEDIEGKLLALGARITRRP